MNEKDCIFIADNKDLIKFKSDNNYSPIASKILSQKNILHHTIDASDNIFSLPLKLRLSLSGRTITNAHVEIGFYHQGIEKILEDTNYANIPKLLQKINPIDSTSLTLAYNLACQKLCNYDCEDSADISVLLAEISRIRHHTMVIARIAKLFSSFWAQKKLEKIEVEINKFLRSISKISKNSLDILQSNLAQLLHLLAHLQKDKSLIKSLRGFAPLTAKKALNLGLSGPSLKACGINNDIRVIKPYFSYHKYNKYDFYNDLPNEGDALSRFTVRVLELQQSEKIINEILNSFDCNQIKASLSAKLNNSTAHYPKKGIVFANIEAPEGQLALTIACDGSNKPQRFRIKTPSFIIAQSIETMLKGKDIDDVLPIVETLGIYPEEMDR